MKEKTLYSQIYNYGIDNAPLTGNPQITYCVYSDQKYIYKRHTNFSYGMINLKPTLIDNNTHFIYNVLPLQADFLKDFIISVDNFDDIIDIKITINNCTQTITKEYLIACNNVTGNIIHGNDILLPMFNNGFFGKTDYFGVHYIGLPLCVIKDFTLEINTNISTDVELRANIIYVDTEERKKIISMSNHVLLNELVIKPYENTNKFNVNINKINNLGILINNFDSFDSIEFDFGNYHMKLTKETINLYNWLHRKILHSFGEKDVILSVSISNDICNNCEIKINYQFENIVNNNKIFMCLALPDTFCDSLITLQKAGRGISTNYFGSMYDSFVFPMNKKSQEVNVTITKNNVLNLKECSIYWKNKNGQTVAIAEKISLIITPPKSDQLVYDFNLKDSKLYQMIHHQPSILDIYTIGFAIKPKQSFPSGEVNISSSLKITWETKEEYTDTIDEYDMHVVLFGYGSC